jgi:hypothetical protein
MGAIARTWFTVTGAAGELDGKTLAHELGSMVSRYNVSCVHRVRVLDKAESVHQLDFSDGAMFVAKVRLDVGLGNFAR